MSNVESLPEVVDGQRAARRAVAVATPSPMDIVSAAVKGGNVEMYREAVALMKDMDAFAARKSFNNALADAKADLPIIQKTTLVDFKSAGGRTTYVHETLADVVGAVVPILSLHGLSHRWRLTGQPGQPVSVTCIISHRDGHFEENVLSAGADTSGGKNPIQGIKSAVTYLERITLMASLGLASAEDDDGRGSHPSTAPRDDRGEPEPQRQADRRSDPISSGPDFPGDRGPVNVTAAEVEHIRALLKKVGADEADFLKWAKRERLEDIPADKFDRCVSAINGFTGKAAQ